MHTHTHRRWHLSICSLLIRAHYKSVIENMPINKYLPTLATKPLLPVNSSAMDRRMCVCQCVCANVFHVCVGSKFAIIRVNAVIDNLMLQQINVTHCMCVIFR